MVECDVHLSQDRNLVVIHDNTLDRTTNGSGWVKDFKVSELEKLNAGDGEKIPTLLEVINLVLSFNKKLVVEIKGDSWQAVKETTSVLADFIKKQNLTKKVVVHSFWLESLKLIKSILPNVVTGVILGLGLPAKKLIALALFAHAQEISIADSYVSRDLIFQAHLKKLKTAAWVLNNSSTFNRMKTMGVEGLITDYPGRFKI
jgi:glycerophosphoryl diester phosphodiesterase